MPSAARVLACALALGLLLSGCGGSAGVVSPTGVDELQIPTQSPDPGDFVDVVDNPWLPLAPGSSWTYDVVGDASSTAARAVVRVLPDTAVVAGVATTQVRTVVEDAAGRTLRSGVASYAQDRAGNVWLFGEGTGPGAWRAGENGALAGLAMPAHPRVGDGYLREKAVVAEERTRVWSLDAGQVVDGTSFDGLLYVETTSLKQAGSARQWYLRGRGLLLADLTGSVGAERWTLVDP
ncbi:MAG: hypothetical protein U0R80_04245 [Nocardioidaceae bacterium]